MLAFYPSNVGGSEFWVLSHLYLSNTCITWHEMEPFSHTFFYGLELIGGGHLFCCCFLLEVDGEKNNSFLCTCSMSQSAFTSNFLKSVLKGSPGGEIEVVICWLLASMYLWLVMSVYLFTSSTCSFLYILEVNYVLIFTKKKTKLFIWYLHPSFSRKISYIHHISLREQLLILYDERTWETSIDPGLGKSRSLYEQSLDDLMVFKSLLHSLFHVSLH